MDDLQSDFVPFSGRNPSGEGNKESSKISRSKQQSIHHIVSPDDDDDASTVDENYDIASLTSSIEDQLTWRGRMQVVIHSLPFQAIILSLVVLDALIVLFELLLDVGAFGNLQCRGLFVIEQSRFCHYEVDNRGMCPPSPNLINENTNLTEGDGSEFCHCVFRGGNKVCRPHTAAHGVNPAEVLHIMSILILSTFLVEIAIKLIAFRMKYFTHKFEVFDGMVVVISWTLDVASIIREEGFAQVATLIIILRLWRVVRIVNGGILSAKAQADDQLHKVRHKVKEVVHALHKAQENIDTQETEIKDLSKILEDHSIPVPERKKLKVAVPKYPYDDEEGIKFTEDAY